jgi:hypothetical protein
VATDRRSREIAAVCVERTLYTDAKLKRERPNGAGVAVFNARRAGLVSQSFDAAKRILERWSEILYRGLDDPPALAEEALSHLNAMGQVFVDLARGGPVECSSGG